ncbi:hypothetical protein [Streptomyces yerevanensis]|uniref:hypothetical protein n=1 Tax=Streptomyces yerevanensis TaxID=66378 RepID=UPI0005263680|nr:hypothetical protein [Streptomyces yerevanensis]
MTTAPRLMPFPEERVLEDAAFGHGIVPTRLHALLLPVWEAEVRADITEGEDFALIDRFLERGLRHGALHTIDELAAFFVLDNALVAQAVRFLMAIGHIEEHEGRLSLTPLGTRSVDDDIRYVLTREDRRKLYFEALSCTPLTRAHYDAETVTLLSGEDLDGVLSSERYPRFTPISVTSGFDRTALDRLNHRQDKARFNLPVALEGIRSLGEEIVYLPVYLVRGHGELLVYGQAGAGSTPDPELSELCAQIPQLTSALDNEEQPDSADERTVRSAENWLRQQGLDAISPERDDDGTWFVLLPSTAFGENGLPVSRVGSYRMAGTRFFRLWCPDANLRKRALLARLDQRLGARRHVTHEEASELVARLARQLRLEAPSLSQLRRGAEKIGLRGLAAQLARLEKEQH